jgi:hypothetical protein
MLQFAHRQRFVRAHRPFRPVTRAGRWATFLASLSIVLMLGWRLTGPAGAFPAFAAAVAGGVLGVVAVVRKQERATAVFLSLVPFAFVVAFVAAALLVGHD